MYQPQAGDWTADDLIGEHVMNAQNEDIGPIVDLIMDQTGDVKAAVISVGGFTGSGDKLIAVPIDDIHLARTSASGAPSMSGGTGMSTGAAAMPPAIVVIMTKEQLQQAPAHQPTSMQGSGGSGRPMPGGGSGTQSGSTPAK